MDFQGGQCKKMENSRGATVNLTGNPGRSTQKGDTIIFWKAQSEQKSRT